MNFRFIIFAFRKFRIQKYDGLRNILKETMLLNFLYNEATVSSFMKPEFSGPAGACVAQARPGWQLTPPVLDIKHYSCDGCDLCHSCTAVTHSCIHSAADGVWQLRQLNFSPHRAPVPTCDIACSRKCV
jgi:hypothetical protein